MRLDVKPWLCASVLGGVVGCSSDEPMEQQSVGQPAPPADYQDAELDDLEPVLEDRPSPDAHRAERSRERRPRGAPPPEPEPEPESRVEAEDDGPDEAMRDWFPEAFLWQPRLELDEQGKGSLEVRVPDALTTWRVWALGHAPYGQQAGAVHTFDSRLPTYLDLVTPGWLYAGDQVALPLQVVNTTSEAIEAPLRMEAEGVLSGTWAGDVALDAHEQIVDRVALRAEGAGPGSVHAELDGHDAVQKTIRVMPTGRPVERSHGGTLTRSRTLQVEPPDGSDASTEALVVRVFPGPLSVLQSEVERAASGGAHPIAAAYGFALASSLSQLAEQTGAELDGSAVRRLRLLAWQRVVHHSRAPDGGVAVDLLSAMHDVQGHALGEELRDRLVRTVVEAQRSDGTWARQDRASLQQILVQTALAARTLPDDARGARLQAENAVERHGDAVTDPYTAAVLLASDLTEGGLREELLEILQEGIEETEAGQREVQVPHGVRNPWGQAPNEVEALAWASLALAEEEVPWKGELVATLMARYDAQWGFGAGPADVQALEAVRRALPGLADPVEVTLSLDGKVVADATLDPQQPRAPAVLKAQTGAQNPEIELSAAREVSGLAYVATLQAWLPWSGEEAAPGIEVEAVAEDLAVGQEGRIRLTLSAPSETALTVEQGVPTGTQVDGAELAQQSGIAEAEVRTDRVRLVTEPFDAGQVLEVALPVRPAFAGVFRTVPLAVTPDQGDTTHLPPVIWEVAGEDGRAVAGF